jgi:hypothetical protein
LPRLIAERSTQPSKSRRPRGNVGQNRIRVLTQRWEQIVYQIELLEDHAVRETETIRRVDPEAGRCQVNGPEIRAYSKEERALAHQIAEETGQLPQRTVAVTTEVKNPITDYDVLIRDPDGNFQAVRE